MSDWLDETEARIRTKILRLGINARTARDVADKLQTAADDAYATANDEELSLNRFVQAACENWPNKADEIKRLAEEATAWMNG